HTRSTRDWSSDVCSSDLELPTNPECFRGCSTCLESELQDEDSFSLLGVALYLALPSVSSTRAELQLEIRRFALSCAYDHGDVEQVERPNRASNQQYSAARMIHAKYTPMPYTEMPGGR